MADSRRSSASLGSRDPWVVMNYEVDMFFTLCRFLTEGNQEFKSFPHHVKNAVVESALLHARVLADIFLSRSQYSDDIRLAALLPAFKSQSLEKLRQFYGNHRTEGTPCWILNKKLAHPTRHRCDQHDYTVLLNEMAPQLDTIWREVQEHTRSSQLETG